MRRTKFDPQKHHRHSIRLKGYDYSQPGAYFVTLVSYRRECLFGEIASGASGEMKLNNAGKIVQWEWVDLPKRYPFLVLGAFMVMPNHFHGILIFHESVRATHSGLTQMIDDDPIGSPLPRGPKPASLGAIVAQFKSRVTKRLWKIPTLQGTPIWQRNYYEHILRHERDMQNITDYIESNPMMWNEDDENPRRTRGDPSGFDQNDR